MKKTITLEQINILTTNADYFQIEQTINNLLDRPKTITIQEKRELPIFSESFTPYVEKLGNVAGTVYPPRLCLSTEPGYKYELEFIQCPLNTLEKNVKLKNLHYSLYDLGLELRWYNKWSGEIIIVPFKEPKGKLMFWVLRKISNNSLNWSYSPNLSLYDQEDIENIFNYNNNYIYFVLSKNEPQINSLEYKYVEQLKSSFDEINKQVGGLIKNDFSVEKLLKFISSQEKPTSLIDRLIDDVNKKNLTDLCFMIIDERKKEIEAKRRIIYSSSSHSNGGIH